MANKYSTVRLGDFAESVSITHGLKKNTVIFLNTSDIYLGDFLHSIYGNVDGLPGQAKKTIKQFDILFSEIRPANGRWAFVEQEKTDDYVVSTKLMVIRTKSACLHPKYLYYFLTAPETVSWLQVLAESRSGTFPQITFDQVAGLDLPLPPLDTQILISHQVEILDKKISLNRRINQTLEAMAQAIFKSWFVDFDPVKAKIAAIEQGQDPLRAAMRAISGKTDAELDQMPREPHDQLAATAALFPDEMEESELGEIPKGWSSGALADLCDLNPESWSAKNLPDVVRYVDLANTKSGEILEVQSIGGKNIPSRARRILRYGDTIVGTVRPGNRSFALVGEGGLTGSTGFAVLRPKEPYWLEFVYLVAISDANIERLAHLADGGAYPAVRPELVAQEDVVIPTLSVAQAFNQHVQPPFAKILINRECDKSLAKLRDTLLPKLISGELSINPMQEANDD